MTNADLFRKIFGLYAEEFWSMPTDKMTAWLVADAPTAEPSPEKCWGCNCPKMVSLIEPDRVTPGNIVLDEKGWLKYCPICGARMEKGADDE